MCEWNEELLILHSSKKLFSLNGEFKSINFVLIDLVRQITIFSIGFKCDDSNSKCKSLATNSISNVLKSLPLCIFHFEIGF